MKVLILGQGAREHALAWKISQSPLCETVYCHPGNAGMFLDGIQPLGLETSANAEMVRDQCIKTRVELAIIGPEVMLAAGWANTLREGGLRVFGPNQLASQLESSKLFAKEFMTEFKIPTAGYHVAKSKSELLQWASGPWPKVLKFDGLAAGKGVIIARSSNDVLDFSKRVFELKEFGAERSLVLIEDFIPGTEISYIGLCDGHTFLPLASATDFKRVGDGDSGPNTGGMGAISPSPYFTGNLEEKIQASVITPLLKGLQSRGLHYRGALFVGLMIDSQENPMVLEFNTRFGDPETQAILLRLNSDLVEILDSTARGLLSRIENISWSVETSVYVVAASENYPNAPTTGDLIHGLDAKIDGSKIFFASVNKTPSGYITAGGRVLGVGALGPTRTQAREQAYRRLELVSWRGQHYRKDIGA